MNEPAHKPVLLNETLELLNPQPGEIGLDCTFGEGGHSAAIAQRLRGLESGHLFAFDRDSTRLAAASSRLLQQGLPVTAIHENFAGACRELKDRNIRVDLLLADLGTNSIQIDTAERGFSFTKDGPLDMRFDPSSGPTAADLIATLPESELANLIQQYGQEPLAGKIARKLTQNRGQKPILSTGALAQLVREVYGRRAAQSRINPATRTFMAFRIAVNDELAALHGLMDDIVHGAEQADQGGWLNPGARIGMIAFHSLEDRPVKRAFNDLVRRHLADHVTKGVIRPETDEQQDNPRSRSAKLRVIRLRK
jgi:16S rRNA (cytosine1402-N4)-methyltransferase